MLPKIDLIRVGGHSTALLVANLDNIAHDFIEPLDVIVLTVHILEHCVEESVHDVFAKLSQDLGVELDGLEIV